MQNSLIKVIFKSTVAFIGVCFLMITNAYAEQVTSGEHLANMEYYPFITEGRISGNIMAVQESYYERIPRSVLELFKQDNWKFVLTSKDIATNYYEKDIGSIAGITRLDEHIIYIENRESAISRATIHEIGHFYDFVHNGISVSDEFIDIWKEESNGLLGLKGVDRHDISNSQEFFAEVFQQKILDCRGAYRVAPKATRFIDVLLYKDSQTCTY